MPSDHYSVADIMPAVRRQLSCIPPAHLEEIISLALEATSVRVRISSCPVGLTEPQQNPQIDFLTAVKALWRYNAHNPHFYSLMSDHPRNDGPPSDAARMTQEAGQSAQQDSQYRTQAQTTPHPYDPDTEMPDAPSPTASPPSSPSAQGSVIGSATQSPSTSTKGKPTVTITLQPANDHPSTVRNHQSHHRALLLSLRDGTHPAYNAANISWQRREQIALTQAYLQAFDLWPHAHRSAQRCGGFLARGANI